MNKYIQQSKDRITEYLAKAQQTGSKIAEGRKIYNAESMDREEKRLRGELAKARAETEAALDRIYNAACADARAWGELDGSKLTADAELLKGHGVTPDQFNQLVEKYKDNYTMLDQLRKYGEAQNEAVEKKSMENGDYFPPHPYNVRGIPSQDDRIRELDTMRKQADHFLNVADGTGFNSDFERSLATSTAQKQFDAWGEDHQEQQQSGESARETFGKVWGFVKE